MLRVCTLSAEELLTTPIGELTNVKELKQKIDETCGVPRFRQRLLLEGVSLDDTTILDSPMDLQLVLLPLFRPEDHSQVRELIDAAKDGRLPEVEAILGRPQDPDVVYGHPVHLGCTALTEASNRGRADVVEVLLEAKADSDKPNALNQYTALHEAARNGHVQVVRLLLQARADANKPNFCRETPLWSASRGNHVEIVRLLVQGGVACSHFDAALKCAADCDYVEVAGVVLDAMAKQAPADESVLNDALHRASGRGSPDILRLLLAARADKDAANSDGDTPLHWACSAGDCMSPCAGHLEVVRLLLTAAADVDKANSSGDTPLMDSCFEGYEEMLSCLLLARADVNKLCSLGKTALMKASVYSGAERVIQLLLDAKASINMAAQTGETALMCACSEGQEDTARFLLQAMADISKVDCSGQTALMHASCKGHLQLASLLSRATAEVKARADPTTKRSPGHFMLPSACRRRFRGAR